ncbi:MAG: hypothetical protein EOO09_00855 [Chitinophagaceae bacterium]|nr:MAG: hypothetical protein EOO09_00855 [Chitinophagaceae bacterium]
MVIEKLRAGTRQTHEELEQEMLPLIREATDTTSYARLLRLFYGYYRPLEKGIETYLDNSVLPDLEGRRKTSWILDDLHSLGQDGPVAEDPGAPLITSRADALGALYVMEGSSLGGKVICKMIGENLGLQATTSLSFFYGYGGQTGSKWKEFLQALDKFSGTGEEEAIVRKADEVFLKFRGWLRGNKF